MTKETPVDHPILDIIRKRWSPRAFSDLKVSQDDMNKIFEAARWAASSANEQPWSFYYAFHGTEGFKKLWECLDDYNQTWTAKAAVLIASVERKLNSKGQPNDWSRHDVGLADAHILLQATALDIYAHPMAGFKRDKLVETLGLELNFEPVCMIALGYIGKSEKLEEPYRSREKLPRKRKAITDFTKLL